MGRGASVCIPNTLVLLRAIVAIKDSGCAALMDNGAERKLVSGFPVTKFGSQRLQCGSALEPQMCHQFVSRCLVQIQI